MAAILNDLGSILTATNALVGLIVVVTTSGAGFIAWMYRRVTTIAKEAYPEAADTAKRVRHIEQQIEVLDQRLGGQALRITEVERRMETVATQRDVAALESRVAELGATVNVVKGMVDTIYRAAIQGSDR